MVCVPIVSWKRFRCYWSWWWSSQDDVWWSSLVSNGSRKTISIQLTRHTLQYPGETDLKSMADMFNFDADCDTIVLSIFLCDSKITLDFLSHEIRS